MACKISISTEGLSLPYRGVARSELRTMLKRVCAAVGMDTGTLALIATDNEYIREINRVYRKKDRPTDIISFGYRDDLFPVTPGEPEHQGDLYLSLPVAFENAARYGVSPVDELRRLLVHGVLHLQGYDHETNRRDAAAMRKREREISSAL